MIKKDITIKIKDGAKPETLAGIVQTASQFKSKVYLNRAGKQVNAKSIMGMMTLGLLCGEEIMISADGADEGDAIEKMEKILG